MTPTESMTAAEKKLLAAYNSLASLSQERRVIGFLTLEEMGELSPAHVRMLAKRVSENNNITFRGCLYCGMKYNYFQRDSYGLPTLGGYADQYGVSVLDPMRTLEGQVALATDARSMMCFRGEFGVAIVNTLPPWRR